MYFLSVMERKTEAETKNALLSAEIWAREYGISGPLMGTVY